MADAVDFANLGLKVFSEITGPGKQSKRLRIGFGVRVMQILAILKTAGKDAPGNIEGARALCLKTINELGPDLRDQIITGYEETKTPAKVSDDDIMSAV